MNLLQIGYVYTCIDNFSVLFDLLSEGRLHVWIPAKYSIFYRNHRV